MKRIITILAMITMAPMLKACDWFTCCRSNRQRNQNQVHPAQIAVPALPLAGIAVQAMSVQPVAPQQQQPGIQPQPAAAPQAVAPRVGQARVPAILPEIGSANVSPESSERSVRAAVLVQNIQNTYNITHVHHQTNINVTPSNERKNESHRHNRRFDQASVPGTVPAAGPMASGPGASNIAAGPMSSGTSGTTSTESAGGRRVSNSQGEAAYWILPEHRRASSSDGGPGTSLSDYIMYQRRLANLENFNEYFMPLPSVTPQELRSAASAPTLLAMMRYEQVQPVRALEKDSSEKNDGPGA